MHCENDVDVVNLGGWWQAARRRTNPFGSRLENNAGAHRLLGLALRLFQHPPSPHQPCGTTFPHTANLAAGHKVGSHPQGHQNGTGKTEEEFMQPRSCVNSNDKQPATSPTSTQCVRRCKMRIRHQHFLEIPAIYLKTSEPALDPRASPGLMWLEKLGWPIHELVIYAVPGMFVQADRGPLLDGGHLELGPLAALTQEPRPRITTR